MADEKPRDIYSRLNSYKLALAKIKSDEGITDHNKKLLFVWLKKKEDKLKSRRGREYEDQLRWTKTLDKVARLGRSVAQWVGKKKLDDLTPKDLKRIYDDLEEGRITKNNGKPYARATRMDYYNKLFKSDFGQFMGWKEEAQEIMTLENRNNSAVKFFRKPILDKLLTATHSLKYKALYSLLFDTGLRIGEALNIRKVDLQKLKDKDKNQDYYRITIRAANTKSKQDRHVSLWLDESNELLAAYLPTVETNTIFPMNYPAIKKHLSVTAKAIKLVTEPDEKSLSPHDFRRSSATYWLLRGIRIDSIKARLGHKPSSTVIDRYVSYLGIDDEMAAQEVKASSYRDLEEQNRKLQEQLRIIQDEQNSDSQRWRKAKQQNEELKAKVDKLADLLADTQFEEYLRKKAQK